MDVAVGEDTVDVENESFDPVESRLNISHNASLAKTARLFRTFAQ